MDELGPFLDIFRVFWIFWYIYTEEKIWSHRGNTLGPNISNSSKLQGKLLCVYLNLDKRILPTFQSAKTFNQLRSIISIIAKKEKKTKRKKE
jgi:hypothetical protein